MLRINYIIILICCLITCSTNKKENRKHQLVKADRWMEMDLSYFNPDSIEQYAASYWKAVAPLYESVSGTKGVIINCGWVPEWVRDWRGGIDDSIMMPLDMLCEPIYDKPEKLKGTWHQQKEKWENRYKRNREQKPHYTRNWTYRQLKNLVTAIKREAKTKSGIDTFRVGTLMVGWDWHKPFYLRHPEIAIDFLMIKNFFNLKAKLKADTIRYAAYPNGIPEGTLWADFFSTQWGLISKNIGFDALLLRDNIFSVGDNRRIGPWGATISRDINEVKDYNDACSYFLKSLKNAAPNCYIIGYSAPAGAIASPRVFNFDLERMAQEGNLDAWIDQTWAGAWNETGVRMSNFWNQPYLGYTSQLANVLINGAILANTKVKHYVITGVWDTWESWDILHTVPERLRWEQWAYWHAAVKKPEGLKLIDGNYIAHTMNQNGTLLNDTDISFINEMLNEAIADAQQMSDVLGPTLVYNSQAISWLNNNDPAAEISEWIDNQAGMLLKWGIPIGSSTRIEYLGSIRSDLYVIQTPNHLDSLTKHKVKKLILSGNAVSVWASPSEGIDPDLQQLMGITSSVRKQGMPGVLANLTTNISDLNQDIPLIFAIYQPIKSLTLISADCNSIYSVEGSPALVLNYTKNKNLSFWDPADYMQESSYGNFDKPLAERLGSVYPFVLASRVLNSQLKKSSKIYVESINAHQPMAFLAWKKKDGSIRILCGNMEEGIYDSTDYSVSAKLHFSMDGKILFINSIWDKKETRDSILNIHLPEASSKLFEVKF